MHSPNISLVLNYSPLSLDGWFKDSDYYTSCVQMKRQTSPITPCQNHPDHQSSLDDEKCSLRASYSSKQPFLPSSSCLVLFYPPPPPPLSLVTINKEGITSEFVILAPAQCDINHLISLMGLNVCVFVCEIMNTIQYVQVKKGQSEFHLKRIFRLKNITKFPPVWIQWSHT